MKRSTFVLFALGFVLVSSCGDDGDGDGGGDSTRALCQKGCTIQASLACRNDNPSTCLSECEEGSDALPAACQSQANVALECVVNRPASEWACDEGGEATLRTGACDSESSTLLVCIVGNGDGTCPFENDAECDDPTGTDYCPAGTDLADCA